jgi:hypothetical protein
MPEWSAVGVKDVECCYSHVWTGLNRDPSWVCEGSVEAICAGSRGHLVTLETLAIAIQVAGSGAAASDGHGGAQGDGTVGLQNNTFRGVISLNI